MSSATIRSSVRPKSSKQPWGTILKPEFGMGYQKMTDYEITQTVDRLYQVPSSTERPNTRTSKKLSKEDYDRMMQRMTVPPKKSIVDSDRRVSKSMVYDMGVVASYAWKGYN